jgi:hypothetical protein
MARSAPTRLTPAQVADFRRDGFLVVPDAVTPAQLAAMRAEVAAWVEESRAHAAPFGTPTIDGRPRCDMGAEHSAERPALRRVNNPSDVSAAYRAVMEDAAVVDMVADLIGPDVKFHHCKINLSLAPCGSLTRTSPTPHTNDDIVALIFLIIDRRNGCLMVVPGSHPGRCTRSSTATACRRCRPRPGGDEGGERPFAWPAGSVCLMHASRCTLATARRRRAASTSAFTPPPTPCPSPTRCPTRTKAAPCVVAKPASRA